MHLNRFGLSGRIKESLQSSLGLLLMYSGKMFSPSLSVFSSMRKWARREAERLIVQKEKEGVPLITENYYDPSKLILPTAGEE